MPELPIESELEKLLLAAVEIIRSSTTLSADQLTDWMQSSYFELQAIAFSCLFERKQKCELVDEVTKHRFYAKFLAQAIEEDLSNDFRPGRFDALLYCRSILKEEGLAEASTLGPLVVGVLAEACLQGDSATRGQVVDVVLEHVLQKNGAKNFFWEWNISDELKPLLRDGIELARKWNEMRQEE